MKINIGVIFGGRSGEYEVSLKSAQAIVEHLDHSRYQIWPIAIAPDGRWYGPIQENDVETFEAANYLGQEVMLPAKPGGELLSADERDLVVRLDVVFNIVHGTTGEDGAIQGLLELAELPYVGAGVAGSAVGMDKILMRKILAYHHIPQVRFMTLSRENVEENLEQAAWQIEQALPYPLFVKPANAGSSVGISKVRNFAELQQGLLLAAKYDKKLLVEQGHNVREIETAVLGNANPRVSVPGEIIACNDFYDYQAKYLDNRSVLQIPAQLSKDEQETIQALAKAAYLALDCAGLARADFFISQDDGQIYFNELNTLPGFTESSMYAKLWQASGLEMSSLLDELIDLAFDSFRQRRKNCISRLL